MQLILLFVGKQNKCFDKPLNNGKNNNPLTISHEQLAMNNKPLEQPPELSISNVSRALFFASVAITLVTLALLWPIRLVHQEFAASNGAQAVPFMIDEVFYGVPCTADYRKCATQSTALFTSDFISNHSLQVIRSAYFRQPFTTLCLYSPGGSVRATIDIISWLQQRNIGLCVSEAFKTNTAQRAFNNIYCYSSCAHLFASADKRIAYGPQPVIGVHDMYYQMNIPLTQRTFRAEGDFLGLALDYRLTRAGIPYETVRAFSKPKSSEIYELTISDMNELNLLTEHRLQL